MSVNKCYKIPAQTTGKLTFTENGTPPTGTVTTSVSLYLLDPDTFFLAAKEEKDDIEILRKEIELLKRMIKGPPSEKSERSKKREMTDSEEEVIVYRK